MTFQLTVQEIGEYAKLKTKFFGNAKLVVVTAEDEADPDYHRYIILNKKVLLMLRFYSRLKKSPHPLFTRVQRYVAHKFYGKCIVGFSPSIGLILE